MRECTGDGREGERDRETQRGKTEMEQCRGKTDSWRIDRPSASAQSRVPAVIAGTLGSGLQGQ